MTVRIANIPRNPYLGYDAHTVAYTAAACLHCAALAPCTLACPQGTDIPRLMRLAGQAACEGLALPAWFLDREVIEITRITDLIADSYN